jgi:hypothetical protein
MHTQLRGQGATDTAAGKGERGRLAAGLALVGAGLTLFAGQFFNLDALPLLILGLIFTAAGGISHTAGWLIPGGVLNGIWLGAMLSESSLATGEAVEGGLFLLGFAAGWAIIDPLARLLAGQSLRWAYLPAAVMSAIGAPLLFGAAGEAVLAAALGWAGYLWPVALVVGGAALMLRSSRR